MEHHIVPSYHESCKRPPRPAVAHLRPYPPDAAGSWQPQAETYI